MYIIIKIAILHSGIRPPHLCEYCIPGKYLAGIAKKEFQKSPFPFRQRAYAVSRSEELIAGGVIKDIPESQLAAALPGAGRRQMLRILAISSWNANGFTI